MTGKKKDMEIPLGGSTKEEGSVKRLVRRTLDAPAIRKKNDDQKSISVNGDEKIKERNQGRATWMGDDPGEHALSGSLLVGSKRRGYPLSRKRATGYHQRPLPTSPQESSSLGG